MIEITIDPPVVIPPIYLREEDDIWFTDELRDYLRRILETDLELNLLDCHEPITCLEIFLGSTSQQEKARKINHEFVQNAIHEIVYTHNLIKIFEASNTKTKAKVSVLGAFYFPSMPSIHSLDRIVTNFLLHNEKRKASFRLYSLFFSNLFDHNDSLLQEAILRVACFFEDTQSSEDLIWELEQILIEKRNVLYSLEDKLAKISFVSPLPFYWIDIFATIVRNDGSTTIPISTMEHTLSVLLKRYGYTHAKKVRNCILDVLFKRKFHFMDAFLAYDDKKNLHEVICIDDQSPFSLFTDGEKYYEAGSIYKMIYMDPSKKLSIAKKTSKTVFTQAKKCVVASANYRDDKEGNEWIELITANCILCIGHMPSRLVSHLPFQEKSVSFWPCLFDGVFRLDIYGILINGEIVGMVTINFRKDSDQKPHISVHGMTKDGFFDGMVIFDYYAVGIQITVRYDSGIPCIQEVVTIRYQNGDLEKGIFSESLNSQGRPVLVDGMKTSYGYLRMVGKFKFPGGGLELGTVQYIGRNHNPLPQIISTREIAKGCFPMTDILDGKWNPKTGVLMNGKILHGDGTEEKVMNGKVVKKDASSSFAQPVVMMPDALALLPKRRAEAWRLGMPRRQYRTALLADYRQLGTQDGHGTSDSLKSSLRILLDQSLPSHGPLRKQFMTRIYQNQSIHKQFLELLLLILRVYRQNRKMIVLSIRDDIREREPKKIRGKDVVRILVESWWESMVHRSPKLVEMAAIYEPYQQLNTIIDLLLAMSPPHLILPDEITKNLRDVKKNKEVLDALTIEIDRLVSFFTEQLMNQLRGKKLLTVQSSPPPPQHQQLQQQQVVNYILDQQQKQQQRQETIEVRVCAWNISWLEIGKDPSLLERSIHLLEHMALLSSDFILLQETPFDPTEFSVFDQGLRDGLLGFLTLERYHRAVVQPHLQVPGMQNQLHGMMILADRHHWEIVQRQKPQMYLVYALPDKGKALDAPDGAILPSMPAKFFFSEPEIAKEEDLNRRALWFSKDRMRDDHHEPHLFAKLSTLSGLFRSKQNPSFYMIVINIHVRRRGYNDHYRRRLLRDINEQIRLYVQSLEKIQNISCGIVIGGDFNREEANIRTDILNEIKALQDGHVIMNPTPIAGKRPIDAFLYPPKTTAVVEDIDKIWQQMQQQKGPLFPKEGHTPFKILLTFSLPII